jgi:hypothetical protein
MLLGNNGIAEARVIRWGTLVRGVPSRGTSLETTTLEVTVADTDHDFAMLLSGSQGHLIQNVSAYVALYWPGENDTHTVWSGRFDSWEQPLPLSWTFTLAPNDMPLRREATPKAHLNVGTWTNIHPTAANLRAPIIYGKHSSISVTNEGFLDAVYVDTKRFRYLIGVGFLKAVTCVYVDGSPADPDTYSIINPVVDNRVYTAVEFDETLDAATVSVDCEGLTDAGAGGGTLMENPVRCFENLMHSFVYGDWRRGVWEENNGAPAPLDGSSLAALETWFDDRSFRCSFRIPCPTSGLEMIAAFCESHEIKAFWTNGGNIALRVEDPATFSYGPEPAIRPSDESVFSLGYVGGRLIDRVEGEYVRDEIAGQFAEQLQVRDVAVGIENEDRLPTLDRVDLDWSAAFVVDTAPTIPPVTLPDSTTNFSGSALQYWYRASDEAFNDGDAVGTVDDQSTNNRDLTQATALRKPTFRTGRVNGRAVYEFDGVDDFVEGSTSWTSMHPSGTWTHFIVFKPHAIEAAEEEDSGFVGHHIHGPSNQDHEGIHVGAVSGGKAASTTIATAGGVAYATRGVEENDWIIATAWADTTYELHLRLGRGEVQTVAAATRSAGSGNIRWGRIGDEAENFLASQAPPPGSDDEPPVSRYFKGEIAECFGYNVMPNDRERKLMLDYLEARYIPSPPAQMEPARNVLSRRLWMRHRPVGTLRVTVPLWGIDWELLDRIWVESPFGPEPTGAGWGRDVWKLRPFSVQRSEVDLEARVVRLDLLDRRPIDALLWDTAWSRLATTSLEGGAARFSVSDRTFERESVVYFASPADPTLVLRAKMHEPGLDYNGELLEDEAYNWLLRSSVVSGTTGLTLTGTGVNGSAIAADTTELLFDPEISGNSLKFTAGNPQANELVAKWPDTESLNVSVYDQFFRLSIDHLDDSGATLYFRLKRLVDNQFWDDSGSTWGSTVDNAITNSTTRARFKSKLIDLGGSNTVVQLEVLQQTGGTASRVNRVFHVQLEDTAYPTSRIVTDDVKLRRRTVDLRFVATNASNVDVYRQDQGTFLAEVTPYWDSADLLTASVDRTVYYITQGAEPEEWHHHLYYDGSAGQWVFEVYINGSGTYQATLTQAVTAGTTYKVASRWTGTNGELGLSSYTYSVFVDGTKGTDATGAAWPGYDGGETLDVGNPDGYLRRRLVRPYPMTDVEVARFEV